MSAKPPAPDPGLCADCQHRREILSARGSRFIRCQVGEQGGDPPKYPRLPVVACPRYAAVREEER